MGIFCLLEDINFSGEISNRADKPANVGFRDPCVAIDSEIVLDLEKLSFQDGHGT